MIKIRIGLDFDGVLTRPIPPTGFLLKYLMHPKTPRIILRTFLFFVERTPIFLNRKRLETLRKNIHSYKFYVISGRKDQNLVEWSLREYWDIFEEIVTRRPQSKLKPNEFKEKVIKAFEIDWYIEDNQFTIYYLRSRGIRAFSF